jgi:hypothetical protein
MIARVADTPPRRDVEVAGALAAGVWLVYACFGQGAITVADGHSMYAVARSLGDHLSFAVPKADGRAPGLGGHYFSPYGLGLPLVSLAPYLLARLVAAVVGHADEVGQFAVSMVMPVIMAGIAAALYAMTSRLGASRRSSATVAVGAIFGTFLLPYGKDFFAEPLVVLCLVLGYERLLARSFGLAALAFGFAVVTRPQIAIACPLLVLLVWHRAGWRPALRVGAILGLIGAMLAIYNLWRFGNVVDAGYSAKESRYSFPFLEALHGFLLDPAKSVVLFAPAVLLLPLGFSRVKREDRDVAVFLVAHAALVVLFYAAYGGWVGGWSWGPRYLLPVAIPLLALLGPLLDAGARHRRAVVALFAVGALVSLPTLVVPVQAQQLDKPVPFHGPSIVGQYERVGPTVRGSFELLTGTPASIVPGSHRLYLDVWQVGLLRKYGRTGFAAGLLVTLALVGISALVAARLRPDRGGARSG